MFVLGGNENFVQTFETINLELGKMEQIRTLGRPNLIGG